MWVSRSRTVTRSLPYLPNSGMNDATGSVRRIRPSSTSIITAGVVATTFVSDAEVEDRVERHRFRPGLDRPLAVGLAHHDGVAAPDHDHGARRLLRGERFRDDGVDAVELGDIEPGPCGCCGSGHRRGRRCRRALRDQRGRGDCQEDAGHAG